MHPTPPHTNNTTGSAGRPILLYNDECGVCRQIARWVRYAAAVPGGASRIDVRPIGEDPQALLALNPALNIWDAYDTVHLLMPDGTMKLGGQCVAELLRRLPATSWFAWCFAVRVFGWQPFQRLLDLGYDLLSEVRPVFGCESCGTPSGWITPLVWFSTRLKALFRTDPRPAARQHFSHR